MLGSPQERPERTQRIIEAPGYKILVYGNHDQNGRGGITTDGFDEAYLALRLAGDPVLVVTHMPLADVPGDTVNVHGHTHQHRAAGATRQVNICVEQLEYQPRRVTEIRRLARELVHENPVPGGDDGGAARTAVIRTTALTSKRGTCPDPQVPERADVKPSPPPDIVYRAGLGRMDETSNLIARSAS